MTETKERLMLESIDDLTAPWLGNGVALATRMLALADELEGRYAAGASHAAHQIREVIRCDYNPLPPVCPPLGDPPGPPLRQAPPSPNGRAGRGRASEPGS